MTKEKLIPHNEINELWKIIKQYHLMIISVTLISFMLAIFYAFVMQVPIYKAKVLIQIGKKDTKLIETANELKVKLLEKHEVHSNPNKTLPKILKVAVYKRASGIIKLESLGHDKEVLKNYLKQMIFNISVDHNLSLDDYINENNESLILAEENLEKTRATLKKIKLKIKSNEKILDEINIDNQISINMYLIKLLRNDINQERIVKRLYKFAREVKKYQKILLDTRTFETHIIDDVIIHPKPITPSKTVILSVGLVSGLLLSILLAFFFEFIANRREEE